MSHSHSHFSHIAECIGQQQNYYYYSILIFTATITLERLLQFKTLLFYSYNIFLKDVRNLLLLLILCMLTKFKARTKKSALFFFLQMLKHISLFRGKILWWSIYELRIPQNTIMEIIECGLICVVRHICINIMYFPRNFVHK